MIAAAGGLMILLGLFPKIGAIVAAVAWVAELFTDPKQRETALGYTQAFSSVGGLLVTTVNGICVALAPSLPALAPIFGGTIHDPHAPWRYTGARRAGFGDSLRDLEPKNQGSPDCRSQQFKIKEFQI